MLFISMTLDINFLEIFTIFSTFPILHFHSLMKNVTKGLQNSNKLTTLNWWR